MNLNLVQICGRLACKPELKTTPGGLVIANFSVASNRSWKDKQGQKQTETEWHNIVAFGKTAEVINQYFDKGDEIYIQGRLKTSTWDAKDGSKRYKTEIMTERFDWGQKARGSENRGQKGDYSQGDSPETGNQSVSAEEQGEVRVEDLPF